MSITLKWPSQVAQELDAIEIYRLLGARTSIDQASPAAALLATLPPDAVQYIDDAVVSGGIYNYWVTAVKGDRRTFSFPITQGFFLDLGPGPRDILIGDWDNGYFGTVDIKEMPLMADCRSQLGNNLIAYDAEFWHKFIYNGKILFIPNRRMGYTTWQQLYINGMVWGVDNGGYVGGTGVTSKNQLSKVRKGENEFIVRLPRAAAGVGLNYASYTPWVDSELRNTLSRLYAFAGSYATSGKPRFRNQPGESYVATGLETTLCAAPIAVNNSAITVFRSDAPEYGITYSYNANHSFIPVFELVIK